MSAVFRANQLAIDTMISAVEPIDLRESLEHPSLLQLPCTTCGADPTLDCECDGIVVERCGTCWHFPKDCECCDVLDDAETFRADSIGYAEVSR